MLPYSSSRNPISPVSPVGGDEPPARPFYKSPSGIIAIVLSLIVLAGAVFAVYYIFFRPQLPNISIQPSVPEDILLGQPFPLTVAYTNASDRALVNASVAVTVSEGMAIIGVDPATRLGQQAVGDLGPQGAGNRTFELMATDGENSVKRVSVIFRYRLGDSDGPVYERAAEVQVQVGAPAMALNFDVPQRVFAGELFDIGVSYKNDSENSFPNAKLILDYPQIFQVEGASSGTHPGGSEWDLGTLSPTGNGEVTVTGKVAAGQQSFFSVGTRLQVEMNGHRYDLGEKTATIGVQSAPLSLAIAANKSNSYTASLGETLSYVLTYRNGSLFALQNVVINASLEGEMFEIGTLSSVATLNSSNNTLTWNTANTPALQNVQPGQSGSVEFRVRLKNAWPIQNANDKDFAVEVNGDIRSLSVPPGISADQTVSSANIITKIAGGATMTAQAYFIDPSGAVSNSGPYPPKANQPTQYTVHWRVRNESTDLENAVIVATLQSGARMVRVVRSNIDSAPQYDQATGQVTWDIGDIPATRGLLGDPIEAIFQIEATPAINQVGQEIPLVSVSVFTARDKWSGNEIRRTGLAKTSSLPDDTQAPGSDGRVQQ